MSLTSSERSQQAARAERTVLVFMLGTVAAVLFVSYCLAIWFDWLPQLRGWGAYPEGWTWPLYPTPPIWKFLAVVIIIASIWAVVSLTELSQRARSAAGARGRRTVKVFFLLAMIVLGVALQVSLLGLKSGNPSALLLQRVTSRVFTGYFNLAASAAEPGAFFSRYPDVFDTTICPHCHSHPPGPAYFYWLSIRAADTLPGEWRANLAARVENLVGDDPSVTETRASYNDSQFLGAFLGGLLILAIAAAVVIPLYGLARLLGPPGYEFRLAALGLALPGLMLMAPEFDQALATATAVVLYVGLRGLLANDGLSSALWGFLGGMVIAGATLFSWSMVALLPLIAAVGLAVLVGTKRLIVNWALNVPRILPSEWISWAAFLVAGSVIPLVLLALLANTDLLGILRYNLENQAQAEAARPYSVWVYQGPVDFLQFLGLPLALMALVSLFVPSWNYGMPAINLDDDAPAGIRKALEMPWYARINIFAVLFWLSLLAIDISGRSKAEQGRLLIFLMPLALCAFYFWVGRARIQPGRVTLLLYLQFAVMLVIGGRWLVP